MYFIKKILRALFLFCIILLAALGAGIAGGLPSIAPRKKEDRSIFNSELFETKENKEDGELLVIKE